MPSQPIQPDEWRRIERLFEEALTHPEHEQERVVREQAGLDSALANEVLGLLAADRAAADGAYLRDAIGAAAAGVFDHSLTVDLPTHIGPYRVLRVIGSGGMGTVLLAERADDSYRQTVAIKVVRAGFGGAERRRRFRRERQILADIDHPNIARLLDGGTLPDSTPYLVMEYIDGVPIDSWCTTHDATLETRIALVRAVCEAVQHAHQSLIVHRDLKPSNILVAADGTPTVLDFGIAKLLDDPDAEEQTATAAHVLTPAFASPEQLRGERVTTASDVYALGLVLFELCTGVPTVPRDGLSLLDVARQRNETDPPRASSVGKQDRRLIGDLDNILAKALNREASRRYGTAGALADDLGRYLAREPVLARPASLPYRLTKFVRRRTREVTMAIFAIGAIVTLTVVNARRLAAERDRARIEADRAEAVAGFLSDLFREADPSATDGEGLSARALLDRGAARIDSALSAEPATRATLELTIAEAYRNLGRHQEARALAERALATREQLFGARSLEVAQALTILAAELLETSTPDSTLMASQRAYDIQRAILKAPHRDLALSLNDLGWSTSEMGDPKAAEAMHREALSMRRALATGDDADVAESLNNLAQTLFEQGDFAQADSLNREALAMRRRLYGESHRLVSASLGNLAVVLESRGDFAAADSLLRAAISIDERLYGANNTTQATSWVNLGRVLARRGQMDSAEAAVKRALAIDLQRGPDHSYVAYDRRTLGDLVARRDPRAAEREYLEAMRIFTLTSDADRGDIAATQTSLGGLYLNTGRAREAERMLRRALDTWALIVSPDHYRLPRLEAMIGTALLEQGRFRDAESTLVAAHARMLAAPAARDSDRRTVTERLARFYAAVGDTARADSIRASN